MVAAQMPSVVAGGVAIMVSSCRGNIVVLIRRTLMVLVGADGCHFMLCIGQAMEWHQHCRQPLQGQGQQQYYCQQFANRFMHIYPAYQSVTRRAILTCQAIDKAVQEKFCMSIVITGILVTVDLTYAACT